MRNALVLLLFALLLFMSGEAQKPIQVIMTSYKGGDRMTRKTDVQWQGNFTSENYISFQSTKKYQTIFGFGGAFTEASAYVVC